MVRNDHVTFPAKNRGLEKNILSVQGLLHPLNGNEGLSLGSLLDMPLTMTCILHDKTFLH